MGNRFSVSDIHKQEEIGEVPGTNVCGDRKNFQQIEGWAEGKVGCSAGVTEEEDDTIGCWRADGSFLVSARGQVWCFALLPDPSSDSVNSSRRGTTLAGQQPETQSSDLEQ